MHMIELYQAGDHFLQRVDARSKIILTLAFILLVNLLPVRSFISWSFLYLLLISMGILSGIQFKLILMRSLVVLPFILTAIPVLFIAGDRWMQLSIAHLPIAVISIQGLERFLSILIKSWLSIQAGIILTATTRFPALMTGFRQMYLPPILITIIELMWRYLAIMTYTAERLIQARSARSGRMTMTQKNKGPFLWGVKVTGNMAGNLLLRSFERSDRVYAAMLSRGFSEKLPKSQQAALSRKDLLILLTGVLSIMLMATLSIFTTR